MTLGYVTIGTDDVEGAQPFFDAALAPLGYVRTEPFPGWSFYGPKDKDAVMALCRPNDGGAARAGNGIMVDWFVRARARLPHAGLVLNDYDILSRHGMQRAHQDHFEATARLMSPSSMASLILGSKNSTACWLWLLCVCVRFWSR